MLPIVCRGSGKYCKHIQIGLACLLMQACMETYIYLCTRGKFNSQISSYFTGSGVDFNSNPFNITINAGATEGRANVSVTCDNEVEGLETFDMTLTLRTNSSSVMLSRDICEGQITDSTGRWIVIVVQFMLYITN